MATQENLAMKLTALEKAGPRGYLRYIFPMKLDYNYDMDKITCILGSGYKTACERIDMMGSEAVPDPDSPQASMVKMQRLSADCFGKIKKVQDLRNSDKFPYTYGDLRARQFSLSLFDGELLCGWSIWPSPEDGMPASVLQINFIKGGIILGWSVLHMIGDANTFFTWASVWAEECRRAQGIPITEPFAMDPAMVQDREVAMRPSGCNEGTLHDYLGLRVLPTAPTGPPSSMFCATYAAQIFYFSPDALKALKAEASPANTTEISGHPYVSTNDAFTALIWRATLGIQMPLEKLTEAEAAEDSLFGIAVDARKHTTPPVHPRTLGCWFECIVVRAPIHKILRSYNLADLAGIVRKGIMNLDAQYTDNIVAIIDKLQDVTTLIPETFFYIMGKSCVVTSWVGLDLHELQWGPLLGDKIEAVRAPSNGISPGMMVVLPRLPDGGIELIVGTEGSLLPKFLHDPLFTKYAVAK